MVATEEEAPAAVTVVVAQAAVRAAARAAARAEAVTAEVGMAVAG